MNRDEAVWSVGKIYLPKKVIGGFPCGGERFVVLLNGKRVEAEYYNYPSHAESVIEIFRGMPLNSFVPLN